MSILPARLNPDEVVQVYTQTAPVYDLWGWLTESKARRLALALAQLQDSERVLEVAVGTGLTFREILKANPNGYSVGVDLTPAMLQKAQARAVRVGGRHYQLAAGDAHDLQFPDHDFDVLMASYLFDLMPEHDFVPILQGFRRVLKTGGRIVLVNMTIGVHVYQRFWQTVYRLNPSWLGGCRGVLLSQAMQAAGFSKVQRETVTQLGFPSEVILAWA